MLPTLYWAATFVSAIYFSYLPSTKWVPLRVFKVYNELLTDVVQNQFYDTQLLEKNSLFHFSGYLSANSCQEEGNV